MTSRYLDPWPARALAGLLAVPEAGDVLPPLWHWAYPFEHPAQPDLGPEGHPAGGLPSPPAPGMRRMFGGGRVTMHRPLRLRAEAVGEIEEAGCRVTSAGFTVVTTRRRIGQSGELMLADEQDILYFGAGAGPGAAGHQPAGPAAGLGAGEECWEVPVSETFLFRFSALTYNAHRIHYDVAYARDHEGYQALVVHGPLQALLMAWFAGGRTPGVFSYRLVSPLLLGQGLVVGRRTAGREIATTVRDWSGRLTATGTWTREQHLLRRANVVNRGCRALVVVSRLRRARRRSLTSEGEPVVRSFTRRGTLLVATMALLFPAVSYTAASQASPAPASCRGVTPAIFPAMGFITDPARTKGGNMWWQRLPDGSVCIGTVVEFVQYNVTMAKTWRVVVYTAQDPAGQVAASATFTVRPGWYLFGFQIRQPFQGLTAVCITASSAFGSSCVRF